MYNKYIGNTGQFVRVEEPQRPRLQHRVAPVLPPPAPPPPPPLHEPSHTSAKNQPSLFGGLGKLGGLGGLLGPGGVGGISNSLKGMFDHLPFGLDIGDIFLFLLLFFFFIESGDEEFLIILAVIAFSLFKER